jgi:hypothetical protein
MIKLLALLIILFATHACAQVVKAWSPTPDSAIANGDKITRSESMFTSVAPRGYNDIYGNDATFVGASNQIMSAGTLKNWHIAAMGNITTNTDTLTVWKNGIATSLRTVLNGTGTASDTTHTVVFATGDRVAIQVSDGSTNSRYKWAFEFDPK